MNQILKIKDEKLPLRYVGVKDIVRQQVESPLAPYLTERIWHQAYLDDLKAYPIGRGELRADDDPVVSMQLGKATWNLINHFML